MKAKYMPTELTLQIEQYNLERVKYTTFIGIWLNNIYYFNQQGKPYIKVSGWQCDYNGVHMCT